MKLCLFQIFFTVVASLGLQSRDDNNANVLSTILVVWLLLTPCVAPFLDLLSEVDIYIAAERVFQVIQRSSSHTVRSDKDCVKAEATQREDAEPAQVSQPQVCGRR